MVKNRSFTVISNEVFQDKRLSWKARAILAYLLTKPDDWELSIADLVKQSGKDGRDSVRAGLRELQELGYMVFEQSRDKRGRKGLGAWTIYESPVLNPRVTPSKGSD